MIKLLDGQKRKIGNYIGLIQSCVVIIIIGIWEYNPEWMIKVLLTLSAIQAIVGGTGTIDGIRKHLKNAKAKMQLP